MTIKERLEFCRICENRYVNTKIGLVCSKTNEKPKFDDNCEYFLEDKKESDRVFKQNLEGTGSSRAQNGSLNPKKNKNSGIFLIITGALLTLISLWAILIIITGVAYYKKGKEQEKVIANHDNLKNKIKSIK